VGSAKRSSIHQSTAAEGIFASQVPFDEAKALIARWIKPVAAIEKAAFREFLGRVLGETVRSAVNVPPHDDSAMDGWAVRSTDLKCGSLPVRSFRSDLTRWLLKSEPNSIRQPAS